MRKTGSGLYFLSSVMLESAILPHVPLSPQVALADSVQAQDRKSVLRLCRDVRLWAKHCISFGIAEQTADISCSRFAFVDTALWLDSFLDRMRCPKPLEVAPLSGHGRTQHSAEALLRPFADPSPPQPLFVATSWRHDMWNLYALRNSNFQV